MRGKFRSEHYGWYRDAKKEKAMQEFIWAVVRELEHDEYDRYMETEIIGVFHEELDALRYANEYKEYHVEKVKVMK